MRNCNGSMAQPPIRSPACTVYWTSRQADTNTKIASNVFENFLIITAYNMLAIYSKKRLHAGPFNGYISCHPRISIEMGTGIMVNPINIITNVCQTDFVPIKGNNSG